MRGRRNGTDLMMFIRLLRECYLVHAPARVLDALRLAPATVDGLRRELYLSRAMVGVTISLLRRAGYIIDCRGWTHGNQYKAGIKGFYHLVSEPNRPGSVDGVGKKVEARGRPRGRRPGL